MRQHVLAERDVLARMNKELLEDEKIRSPMNVAALRDRFDRFVDEDGWSIEVFLKESEIVGYITYRSEPDPVAPTGQSIHLRQFYIARSHRRQGLGAAAIALFKRSRLKDGDRIVLDVLDTNPRGKRFWQSVGFVPYATIMEGTV